MPKTEKSDVRRHLFSMFLDQLKEDTSLLSQYGTSFEEACHSLNYATAVRYEMLNAEADDRFKQQIPSAHTILRWLQRGDFSAQVQARSVLAVARYLGYEHFDDYLKSIAEDERPLTPTGVALTPVQSFPLQVDRSYDIKTVFNRRGMAWGILGAALGTLLTYGFVLAVSYSKPVAVPPSELHVKSLIERANAFEYNLYAQLGRQPLDTSGQHLFFTESAPAWRTINQVLKGSQEDHYVLNIDRSKRALVSVEIQEVADSIILVKSKEAWTILWESENSFDKQYDVVNEQSYTLKNERGRWKVYSNSYAGE